MSTPDQVKVAHGLFLMSRFESMKERELICDFTIKVGDKSFPVHRAVLVASPDYFEGMFSSNMKEVREGCVEMKNLGVNAIEQAIKFMYTGSAKITMESVQYILHVAELFQLDGLKNLCFQFLLDNLSAQNCLPVINLAQTYNRRDVMEEAERILVTDFESVISSEMFPSISRSDLLRYISNVGHETSWKAAITWAKEKEEFPQLIESMDVNKFPFKFLLETVLEEPLAKKSESVIDFVISILLSDADQLRKSLDTGNCIHLKNLAKQHGAEDTIHHVINDFFQANFEKICTTSKFCDITENDIFTLFQSPGTKYSSETVKWEAALKWVKHDIQSRKKVFAELFFLVKLEDLTVKFLNETVRVEHFVEESKKCTGVLMDAFISKAKCAEKPSGFCLKFDQQPNNGRLSYAVLKESLPGFSNWKTWEIEYSFPAGKVQGITYPDQQFKAYLPLYADSSFPRLRKAFDAGLVFRLEYSESHRQGRIVWGNIPHKTNKTGGPTNNGYPDSEYMTRLDKALTRKGLFGAASLVL